jgi:hypothetical protein
MYFKRLAYELADRVPWVERAERVLKDNLHIPAQGRQLSGTEPGEISAFEADCARSLTLKTEHGTSSGRLPAPALTHKPERLVPLD